MDFIRREETNVLVDERKVLDQIAEVVQQASYTDPGMLSREELADLVTNLAAEAERLSAVAGRFLAVGEDSACSYTKGEATMIGLVNSVGHLSRARACSLRRAGNAHHRFPSFHAALLEGSITLAHVDLMTRWAKKANTDQVAQAEASLAAYAVLTTPEEFEEGLRQWVAVADPHQHLNDFITAQARKHLILQKDLFDNVHITGVLEPLLGEQVAETIRQNALKLTQANGELGLHEAQHDALVRLILDPHGDGIARPSIEIIAPHHDPEDLVGPNPDPGPNDKGRPSNDAQPPQSWPELGKDPAIDYFAYVAGAAHRASKTPLVRGFSAIQYPETAGRTLVPPTVLASIIRQGGRVRRHQLDETGNLIEDRPTAGPSFTERQERLIRLRDKNCQYPGCRRPHHQCEFDHVVARHRGGPTTIANGQLLCRLHHRWKHRHDADSGPSTELSRLFADSPVSIQRE